MRAAAPDSDRWKTVFPDETPAYPLTERLRRLVVQWEEMPFNRPGSDKTWVERSTADYEAVIREARLER